MPPLRRALIFLVFSSVLRSFFLLWARGAHTNTRTMNPKVLKAINTLKEQSDKLPVDDEFKINWVIQTSSYIRDYFGETDENYLRIKSFSLFQSSKGQYENWFGDDVWVPNKNYNPADRNIIAKDFLKNCVEILEKRNYLYKKPKKNFLSTISEAWLIFWIGLAFAIIAGLGKYISDIQNVELKRQVKDLQMEIDHINDSLHHPVAPANTLIEKQNIPIGKKLYSTM